MNISIFKGLSQLPKRRPFAFSVSTAVGKCFIADLLVQKVIEKRENINWKRNITLSSFGFFYIGGFCYALYSKIYPMLFNNIQNKYLKIISQTTCDVYIHSAFIYFPIYYLYKDSIDNQMISLNKIYKKYFCNSIKKDMFDATIVWYPTHLITFSVMPLHLRVPWMTFVSFFWTMILSGKN